MSILKQLNEPLRFCGTLTLASSQPPRKPQCSHPPHQKYTRRKCEEQTRENWWVGIQYNRWKKKKGPRSPRPTGRPMPSQSLNNSYLEAKPTTPFRGCSVPWAWCSTAGDIPSASLGQPSWLLPTLPTSCPPPAYWLWGRVGKLKRLGPAQALFSNGQTTGAYQRRFSRKTKTRHHMGCSEEI